MLTYMTCQIQVTPQRRSMNVVILATGVKRPKASIREMAHKRTDLFAGMAQMQLHRTYLPPAKGTISVLSLAIQLRRNAYEFEYLMKKPQLFSLQLALPRDS